MSIDATINAIAALSDAAPIGYIALGLGGAVLVVIMVVGVLRARFELPKLILTFGGILGAAMMLTGAVPWQYSGSPGLFLSALVAAWSVILTLLALLVARLARVPAVIAATALTVAAFTVDAALGAVMEPGSMINSRPIFGLRWYGFGNVTFAAYASAGLVLAGYVAHRLLTAGRRAAAVATVAAIGFGIVICEGWPSMGSDFGGVIALTPAVLWLMLALSGVEITWQKLLAIGGSAVLAVGVISVLDWRRGPDRRTHLGNFVQRVLDGDALDVISRKAVASARRLSPSSVLVAADRRRVVDRDLSYVVRESRPISARCGHADRGADGRHRGHLAERRRHLRLAHSHGADHRCRGLVLLRLGRSQPLDSQHRQGRAPVALRPWQTVSATRPEPQSSHNHGLSSD
jgi:hypothetical protein